MKRIILKSVTCVEASQLSRETFIACGAPAVGLVWHDNDRKAYPMCAGCCDHNISNRGGKLLAVSDEPLEVHVLKRMAELFDKRVPQFTHLADYGSLVCDREIPGVTQKLADGLKLAYGDRYFLGETISRSAAEQLAALLGGTLKP